MLKVYAQNRGRTPLQKALDEAAKNMTPQQKASFDAARAGRSTYQTTGRP